MKRNSGDQKIRGLERRVLSGDLSAVHELARAYDRAGRGVELTAIQLVEEEPPFAVYLFEHAKGMTREAVVEAARQAIKDALAGARGRDEDLPEHFCWGDAADHLSDEDWKIHGLNLVGVDRIVTVDRFEDFSPEDDSSAPVRVSATVSSDDGEVSVDFNAAPWFAQASDDEILGLAAIRWQNGAEADAVAEFFRDNETRDLFDYIGTVNRSRRRRSVQDPLGFEVEVDRDEALGWIARHRPDLAPRVLAEEQS